MDEATPAAVAEMTAAFAGPGANDLALQWAANVFYTAATPAHLPPIHARRIAAFDPRVMAEAMRGIVAPESFSVKPQSERYLQRIKAPALAFRAGKQDPSAVAVWEREQFRHPQSRAVAWEGTGHWLHQERPAEFNSILLDWIASLD
jgi:pimeloyl-ACP methyl ester carboxylesterase